MTSKISHSFKFRLCAWILGISLVVFSMIFASIRYYVTDEVSQDVRSTIWAKLDYVVRSLDEGLTATEVSAENLVAIAHSPFVASNRDSIISLCNHFLEANPRIQGVAVGFEHSVVSNKQLGFCPYVMRQKDGSYITQDLALNHDYQERDWYRVTAEIRKANWSKPFRETNGTLVTAYCLPLMDASGKMYGVMAVDLNLDVIGETIQDLRPYPSAMLTVSDREGTFIAHPDHDYILNESIRSLVESYKTGANLELLDMMARQDRGMGNYDDPERGKVGVFFVREQKTGWTVTMEVPQDEVAPGLFRMTKILFVIMLLGTFLLVSVCAAAINRMTRPLESFAEAAREISNGNFDVKLPQIRGENELHDLQTAMSSMKDSLDDYIAKLEETTKSKTLIEGELNIARKIQMAMVPKIFPPYPDRPELDLFASITPAKAVGGDLYDYLLDGDDFYFCIGDVSGKGVPASLFMAITRSLFRNNVTHAKSPAAIATLLNNAIAQGNEQNMFVTMIIGCCNLKTGHLTYCNCGHNAAATNGVVVSQNPLVVAPSDQVHLMTTAPINLPIGVFENFEYKEVSFQVQSGVKILLYTDGVTEAVNTSSELYGEERMLQKLSSVMLQTDSKNTIRALLDDVHEYAGGAEQSDDITVLCMAYREKS